MQPAAPAAPFRTDAFTLTTQPSTKSIPEGKKNQR
jgi:hypothetical protein